MSVNFGGEARLELYCGAGTGSTGRGKVEWWKEESPCGGDGDGCGGGRGGISC